MGRALTIVASGLLALPGCSPDAPDSERIDTAHDMIVGGQFEEGWAGVGALVRTESEAGYQGVFCSATVIAPRWALTAAHCIRTEDFEPLPEEVQLYLGLDARPTASGDAPSAGALHRVGALISHPSYARGRDFDIGLVYLSDPASDVPAFQLRTIPLTNANIDADMLHVGFGVDDAVAITGSGLKRSTTLSLLGYEEGFFFSEPDGSGFCFGDSGGPAIIDAAGDEPRIAGVASRFEGEPPCIGGFSLSTRVDAHVDWLEATMAAPAPGCDTYEGRCACEGACQSDGTCDGSACADSIGAQAEDDGGCAVGPRLVVGERQGVWVLIALGLLLMRRRRKGGGRVPTPRKVVRLAGHVAARARLRRRRPPGAL